MGFSVSWAHRVRMSQDWAQDSLRHIRAKQGQEGPSQAFHGFRIGPLPHRCPALPGGCQETWNPHFSFPSEPSGWHYQSSPPHHHPVAKPSAHLASMVTRVLGSAHQVPVGHTLMGDTPSTQEVVTVTPGTRLRGLVPPLLLPKSQEAGQESQSQPMSLAGSWLCHRQAGWPWATPSPPRVSVSRL